MPARPQIFISAQDHDHLERLVGDLPGAGVAGLLQQELDRAVIERDGRRSRGAPLYRWLTYVDDRSDTPRRIQIVMPEDADIDAGKVSILSHVGAGLIGMAEGRTISWTDPSGAERRLTLMRIEAADDNSR